MHEWNMEPFLERAGQLAQAIQDLLCSACNQHAEVARRGHGGPGQEERDRSAMNIEVKIIIAVTTLCLAFPFLAARLGAW
jgi:hypothetical protein